MHPLCTRFDRWVQNLNPVQHIIIKEAEFIVANSLSERMKERTTFSDIKNCIRSTLEPFLYKKTRRNPIVIPVILNSRQTMEELKKRRAQQAGHASHKTAHRKSEKPQGSRKQGAQKEKSVRALPQPRQKKETSHQA